MPDRSSPAFRLTIAFLLVTILCLCIVTVVAVFNASDAVQAQRTSGARGECRAKVVNSAEDKFRHRIGDLLDAASRSDSATVVRIAEAIRSEPSVNKQVDETCPKPLVASTPGAQP